MSQIPQVLVSDGEHGSVNVSGYDFTLISKFDATQLTEVFICGASSASCSPHSSSIISSQTFNPGDNLWVFEAGGREFNLLSFTINFVRDGFTQTVTMTGYRDGVNVATFTSNVVNGFDIWSAANKFGSDFQNIDRLELTGQSTFVPSISPSGGLFIGLNSFQVGEPVVPDDTAPVITGPSGGAGAATSEIEIDEGVTAVTTFTADENVTWSISGGADAGRFDIDPVAGVLTFKVAPDFENPTDSDRNNTYIVTIRAVDAAGNESFQTLTVTIGNVDEIGRKLEEIGDRLRKGLRTYATQSLSDMLSFNEGLMRNASDSVCADNRGRNGLSGGLNANESSANLDLNFSQNLSQCGRPYQVLADIGVTQSRMSGNWNTRMFGSLRFEANIDADTVIGLGVMGSRSNDRLLGFADSSISDNSLQASLYTRYRISETLRTGAFAGFGRAWYDFGLTESDGFVLDGSMKGKRKLFGWMLSGDFNIGDTIVTTDAIVSRAIEKLGDATLDAQYLGENRSDIAFRVGTVDVTRISVPVTAPIHLTGSEGFGTVTRLLLSPGLLCEDNNADSSALNCGYQLGAKLVASDSAKGRFYADYRWESVGALRRSLLGLGYAYRFGPKNGLEVALEANRGITGMMGQDNRAMLTLRVAQ